MNAFADILEAIAHAPIQKRAMTNHGVLNEAFHYAKPSSFSRGMRIDIGGVCILLISGTASIDENATSIAITTYSMPDARPSSRNRDSTRCPHPPAFRRICAGRNC